MVLIQNYGLAIFFCVIACICRGSWANTQKIAAKTWRFELFYRDMVIGIVVVCALAAFTLGSFGSDGRSFMADLETADFKSIGFAMLGGALWNLGTLLLVAAISVAVIAGFIIAFFYGFVVKSIDPAFIPGSTGNLAPYISLFFFSMGVLVSTFILNPIFMAKPIEGEPVTVRMYF